MLISVLMSVYNSAATLKKAVDSILAQTCSEFEFIICDDASTDESWSMILEYEKQDGRIRTMRNEKNCGLAYSLNRCFEQAKGKYIARQDADDISELNRLERTLEYLQTSESPYVGCGVYVFDKDGIWSQRMFPEQITKHIIAQKNPFFHPTMLFRREVMEQVGGYRALEMTRRTEDYDLVMRLASKGVIGRNLQEYLYYVYEPPEAYLRHTPKTRWCEIKVRLYGLQQMQAPLRDYVFLVKPVVMCLIPRKLLKHIKRLQWKTNGKVS